MPSVRDVDATIGKIPIVSLLWDFVPDQTRRRIWSTLKHLVIVSVIGSAVQYGVGTIALRNAIAETDAKYPRWRWVDIEAARQVIPDERNAALVLLEAHKLYDRKAEPENFFAISEALDELAKAPNHRSRSEHRDQLQQYLAPFAAAMPKYQSLINYDTGRFPLKESGSLVSRILVDVTPVRKAGDALRYESLRQIEEGQFAQAAESIRTALVTARSVGDDPTAIAMLVRIAMCSIATQYVERLLAQCQLDDAKLQTTQAMLELEAAESLGPRMAIGERAFNFEVHEEFKGRPVLAWQAAMVSNIDWTAFFTEKPSSAFSKFAELRFWMKSLMIFVPGYLEQEQASAMRAANRFVEFSKLSLGEQDVQFTSICNDHQVDSILGFSGKAMSKLITAERRCKANLRCHIFAIAAERFRLKHGQWPRSMDQLVETKLIARPLLDPFDGQPLRWREFELGRLVYSIGEDRTDNGGDFTWDKRWKPGSDVVVRLFDLKNRGLPALPAKAEDTDKKLDPD